MISVTRTPTSCLLSQRPRGPSRNCRIRISIAADLSFAPSTALVGVRPDRRPTIYGKYIAALPAKDGGTATGNFRFGIYR
jgi:hypothetical protein